MSTRKVISLEAFHRIYVERRLNENNHLDEIIVAELRRLGKDASSGPLTMMPSNTHALLTYEARWAWDFKTYLIEFTLQLHTIPARKKLADARYHQPSVKTKSASEVVHELLTPLFAK